MAKKNALDEGEIETLAPVRAEKAEHNLAELLAAPKTKETGGEGTGGRELVLCETGVRAPRQGDQSRPQCPHCTNDAIAVLCGAGTSPRSGGTATTRFYCPRCNFSVQKLRSGIAGVLGAVKTARPFVERS